LFVFGFAFLEILGRVMVFKHRVGRWVPDFGIDAIEDAQRFGSFPTQQIFKTIGLVADLVEITRRNRRHFPGAFDARSQRIDRSVPFKVTDFRQVKSDSAIYHSQTNPGLAVVNGQNGSHRPQIRVIVMNAVFMNDERQVMVVAMQHIGTLVGLGKPVQKCNLKGEEAQYRPHTSKRGPVEQIGNGNLVEFKTSY
jgi:hypothetical protein